MDTFHHLSVQDALALIEQPGTTVADIRDPDSFAAGHIPGARHLSNSSLPDFLEKVDPDQPLIVCCYHGMSSQSAAQFFVERGFDTVYSLDGGFEAWRQAGPVASGAAD